MSKVQSTISALAMVAAFAVPALAPAQDGRRRDRDEVRSDRSGSARSYDRSWDDRRDDRSRDGRRYGSGYGYRETPRGEWRDLGVVSGLAGVAGLLTGNRTLAALGLGGGLYSAYRYDQDRRSLDREARSRYELFRRPAFEYGGHHYVRQGDARGYRFSRAW